MLCYDEEREEINFYYAVHKLIYKQSDFYFSYLNVA